MPILKNHRFASQMLCTMFNNWTWIDNVPFFFNFFFANILHISKQMFRKGRIACIISVPKYWIVRTKRTLNVWMDASENVFRNCNLIFKNVSRLIHLVIRTICPKFNFWAQLLSWVYSVHCERRTFSFPEYLTYLERARAVLNLKVMVLNGGRTVTNDLWNFKSFNCWQINKESFDSIGCWRLPKTQLHTLQIAFLVEKRRLCNSVSVVFHYIIKDTKTMGYICPKV